MRRHDFAAATSNAPDPGMRKSGIRSPIAACGYRRGCDCSEISSSPDSFPVSRRTCRALPLEGFHHCAERRCRLARSRGRRSIRLGTSHGRRSVFQLGVRIRSRYCRADHRHLQGRQGPKSRRLHGHRPVRQANAVLGRSLRRRARHAAVKGLPSCHFTSRLSFQVTESPSAARPPFSRLGISLARTIFRSPSLS